VSKVKITDQRGVIEGKDRQGAESGLGSERRAWSNGWARNKKAMVVSPRQEPWSGGAGSMRWDGLATGSKSSSHLGLQVGSRLGQDPGRVVFDATFLWASAGEASEPSEPSGP
jgi:hypothetical protein